MKRSEGGEGVAHAWTSSWREWISTVLDIVLVAFLIYQMLVLIRGTRAMRMLLGIVVLIGMYFLSRDEYLALPTLHWLLDQFMASFLVIVIVIFQEDIRRALSRVGRNPIIRGGWGAGETQVYEDIIRAVTRMARHKVGALIVVQRNADLAPYTQGATRVNADVSVELLWSIFALKGPDTLHDGAVIIQEGRIAYARCWLPLTTNPDLDPDLGTRHRAALGLSELTDAFVIVVSEETGTVSVAVEGQLFRGLDEAALRTQFVRHFGEESAEERSWVWRLWRRGGRHS